MTRASPPGSRQVGVRRRFRVRRTGSGLAVQAPMNRTSLSGWVSVLAVVWVAGCDGEVVNQSTGSGGDGGSGGEAAAGGGGSGGVGGTGGSPGTGATTGTTTNTTTGTGGTETGMLCAPVCAAANAAGCGMDVFDEAACVQACEGQYEMYPQCADAIDAAYACALEALPATGCDLDVSCGAETDAAEQCIMGN